MTGVKMPFCPGCGHGPSALSISKALKQAGYTPLDVVMVSDIGCSGLVDPLFNTHTVHGLHGRSPAIGLGISLGLSNPGKKVIVIQGDGGATIGLQHLLEAARRNVNMTLIVLNNLIYGMTGGQISGLSTREFKDVHHTEDTTPPFDVCLLAHHAGASYCARVTSPRNFTARLNDAFAAPGFSLVEISSLCQPYGAKKMNELNEWTVEDRVLKNNIQEFKHSMRETKPLFSEGDGLKAQFSSKLKKRIGIALAGSAGGGVQSAAQLLAKAGILSGLSATMKGEYPITIGTGFSVAEIILSKEEINFTGLERPDVVIILTEDGLVKIKGSVHDNAELIMDCALNNEFSQNAKLGEFTKIAGKKGAALCALAWWLNQSGLLSLDALIEAASRHKHADKLREIITASNRVEPIIEEHEQNR